MDKGNKFILLAINIMGIIKTMLNMEKAFITGKMGIYMLENGNKINEKVMANSLISKVINMKAFIKII